MNRLLQVPLLHVLLVLSIACTDESPAPTSAIPPGTPTPGMPTPGTPIPGTPTPGTETVPDIDPTLHAVFQQKIREHRAEMARIAGDEDLTPAELAAYAVSIGRPIPGEIDPAEIPQMQQMISSTLQRTPNADQMVPLAIRTEGTRALFVYRHAAAPPAQLVLGSTIFERDGGDWRLLRSFGTDSPIPAGMSVDEAAQARLGEPDFTELYSPRELVPLMVLADSLAADLQLWTGAMADSRQCDVSIGGVKVLDGVGGDERMLLLGQAFGQRQPLGQTPLASHFVLSPGTNEITLHCEGSTSQVEVHITRRGHSLPSVVVALDPAGSETSGSFELAGAESEPSVPAFVTNRSTEQSGFVLVRETRGVGIVVSVDGQGGSTTNSTGAPMNISLRQLGSGTHAGSVILRGLRAQTDTRVQIAVVAPGESRTWTVPITGTASEEIAFSLEVPDSPVTNEASPRAPGVRGGGTVQPHVAPDYQPPTQ